MAIRIVDTSNRKTIEAKGGKDAALVVGNVLNRQWYEQHVAPQAQKGSEHEPHAA